jgi:amino acid permease
VPGVFFLLLSAGASSLGLVLLARVALCLHPPVPDDIVAEPLYPVPGQGKPASFASSCHATHPQAALYFDMAITLKCFGVLSSYLVIVGDLVPKIMQAALTGRTGALLPLLLERRVWITLSLVLVTPLAFARQLSALRYTSMLAISSALYLVLLVTVYYFVPPHPASRTLDPVLSRFLEHAATALNRAATSPSPGAQLDLGLRWDNPDFFRFFPIFVFSFTCQQNVGNVNGVWCVVLRVASRESHALTRQQPGPTDLCRLQ